MPYQIDPHTLHQYKDQLNISPNGVAFLKPEVRTGVLKKMLSEILDTRIMVKESMKRYKDSPSLLRRLDSRQLGLKFIANVTYGYTSASFSGRMPCVDIADSIVQTGREILENAIKHINEHSEWGARVIYGDTDRFECIFMHRKVLIFSIIVFLCTCLDPLVIEPFRLAKKYRMQSPT